MISNKQKNQMKKHNEIECIFIHCIYAIFIGITAGLACGLLGQAVKLATQFRGEHSWLIYLLPIAGIVIVFVFKLLNVDLNYKTNKVIKTIISKDEGICFQIAPAIFISTVITHLFGGSAGKESAGILIGTSVACFLANKTKNIKSDIRIVTMCGIAAGFSALFGTPITAAIFAVEIVYSEISLLAAVPVIISSVIGKYAGSLVYMNNETYILNNIPSYSLTSFEKTLLLIVLASAVSIIMVYSLEKTSDIFKRIRNDYSRIIIGGIIVSILIVILGKDTYAGAGLNIIEQAISGQTFNYEFLIKILLTSITLGAGYKGGEIVPTLFIGATFGSFVGPLFGLDAGFAAAVSMIILFSSNTNCPIASIALAYELFGPSGIVYFILSSIISFLLTNKSSLYSNTTKLLK